MLEQKRIQIAAPVEQIKIPLSGIAYANMTENLRDLWSIEVEVDKYIDGEINPSYDYILPLMQIYVEDYGWFILPVPPEEHDDGNRVYKDFTIYSIEQQLQQENVTELYINTGDEYSREYYEENIDPLGNIIRNGRLYIPNESDSKSSDSYWELGLLNILQREYMSHKGWTIGHVDTTLAAKRGRTFTFTSTNVYAILTQDIPKAFMCLPIFDRENKTVNYYELKNFGKAYNFEFSFRNFLNDVARVNQKDEFYTRLKVKGGNDSTSIAPYNFGSEYVEDFTYLFDAGVIEPTLRDKYIAYQQARDNARDSYLNAYLTIANLQAEIDRVKDLHPIDAVTTAWNAQTIVELREERAKWLVIDQAIVAKHGTDNLQPYDPDYSTLKSIRDVIIPDIDKEIERQEEGSQTNFEHINYKIIWELYGTNELAISKESYQNAMRSLAAKGYDEPWEEGDPDDKGTHDRNYANYVTYQGYVSQITTRLDSLNAIISQKQTQLETAQSNRDSIAESVKITNPTFGFTNVELTYLDYLRIDCDYTDSSIEVLNGSDYTEVSECAVDLYESAIQEAAIVSRPQRRYEFSTDNPFLDETVASRIDGLTVGDFLYFEIDNDEKLKQRVVSITFNLLDMNDIAYSISMSDMTYLWGIADDYRFLLDTGSGASASSISNSYSNNKYISGIAYSAASEVIQQYMNGGGGSNALVAGLSEDEILILADKLSGLVEGALDIEELKATFATVENLEAEHVYAGTIEANLASFETTTTTQLNAAQASINVLDADVGNINNLLAGNAGTGTLTAIHITSDNVVVEDAFITNAMIDDVSADKITSGSIITDYVTITSEDGGIQIAGNTQQWTDGNGTVRMQAGQDAQGNFTFAVFGADGTTAYFDETGIHADAVPDGLIVNKMVANNANISASKLNIDSLFNVINTDTTHTLSSTKIWIDDEQQSLGAKLATMTTGISDNASSLSTLESDYEVLNGKVSANITAIEKNQNDISTMNTTFSAQIGSIQSTVSSVSAQVDENKENISSLSTQTTAVTQDLNGYKITVSQTYQTLDAAAAEQQAINQRLAEIQEAAEAGNLEIEIESSAGNIFKNSGINTQLIAHAYFRGEEVTGDIPSWTWVKHNADGTEDATWTKTGVGNIITITSSDVQSRATFYARATYTTT